MEEEIINFLLNVAHKENKCVIIISHSKFVKSKMDEVYHLVGGHLTDTSDIKTSESTS